MPSKLAEISRNFNPMLAPGLSDEARKAVKAAFDAMSTWRTETVNDNEKNLEPVIDKIAAAARALGWPEEIAETTRAQMQTINKMQLQMVDHMMDAWEGQISSPSSPSSILSKLRSSPPLSPAGNWPFSATSQMADPFGVYMQIAQQWQKGWTDALFGQKPVGQTSCRAFLCDRLSQGMSAFEWCGNLDDRNACHRPERQL